MCGLRTGQNHVASATAGQTAASGIVVPYSSTGDLDSPIVPLAGLTRDNIGRLESVPPLAVMARYKGICVRIGVGAAIRIAFNGQYLFCDRAFCDEIERTGLNLYGPLRRRSRGPS